MTSENSSMKQQHGPPPENGGPIFPYRFRWSMQGRKNQHCRVTVRGPRTNAILVEFEDGGQLVTHANAVVRRAGFQDSAQVRRAKASR